MEQRAKDEPISYCTLDGDEAHLARTDLEKLRAALSGRLSTKGDAAYEQARQTWNAMIDRHPALIGHPTSPEEVGALVRFAREHSMLLSVRCGGHHIAGNAIAEEGLEIDLSRMRAVRVDAEARRARVEGGALLSDVDHATQAFGLATPLGINSTTGFGGLCLGGGFGWLTRKHGLTIDNLISADVVTASGDLLVASATSEPDLFWAIRGGGGNFGVVTSFELQLHPVGPMVHAGLVVYPFAAAREVLHAWRDFMTNAPEELSVWTLMRKAPPLPFLPAEVHGTDVLVLIALYAGDAEAGARATAPLLQLGRPLGHALGAQPYEAFQQAFDPMLRPGVRNYWKTNEFADLDAGAIDAIVEGARGLPGPDCEVFVASLGGAMGRVASDATAYTGRDSRFLMNVHGRWQAPADDDAVRTWARGIFEATAPFSTGGGYVNFMTADEQTRVAAAYGANYERLQEVKRRFDPDNLFRMNHNIPPNEPKQRTRRRQALRP